MSFETISVVYKLLGSVNGINVYHETLVYTDANGQQSYVSAYATNADTTPTTASNFSQAVEAAAANSTSVYGTLNVESGSWDPTSLQGMDKYGNPRPSEIVASGADLSSAWAAIQLKEYDIAIQNLPYSPLTQNSNSVATTALKAAGISPPIDNGINSTHWAPAADYSLQGTNPLNLFGSLLGWLGNTVMDILIPPAYGAETTIQTQPDNSATVSTTYPNGNISVINHDAGGNVTGVSVRTVGSDGSYSIATADATGITTRASYDANNQVISTGTLDTTTNSGTTRTYTNGALASQTDFGPSSAATTTYNADGTVSGATTANSDNTGSSMRYDASGNTIYKTSTGASGAVTITTIDPATRIEATQYPDGALSTKTADGYGYSSVSTMRPDRDGSNVTKWYYDNANNVLAEKRTTNADWLGYASRIAANDGNWRLAA